MKLQKIVFLIQGTFLSLMKQPLFQEDFVLWKSGPVCKELHNAYRLNSYTVLQLLPAYQHYRLPEVYARIVDEFVNSYSGLTGLQLKELIEQKYAAWSDLNGTGYLLFKDEIKQAFDNHFEKIDGIQ